VVASELARALGRCCVFDAFGHPLEPEVVAEFDGGAHDGEVFRVVQQILHQYAVDTSSPTARRLMQPSEEKPVP
jgi:hypothetical protein